MPISRLFALIAVFLIPLAGLAMIGKSKEPRVVTAIQVWPGGQVAAPLEKASIAPIVVR